MFYLYDSIHFKFFLYQYLVYGEILLCIRCRCRCFCLCTRLQNDKVIDNRGCSCSCKTIQQSSMRAFQRKCERERSVLAFWVQPNEVIWREHEQTHSHQKIMIMFTYGHVFKILLSITISRVFLNVHSPRLHIYSKTGT